MLNVYAPTEKAKVEEKDKFYEKVEEEIEKIPKEDTLLVLGDFNAQIGREEYLNQIAGEFTLHERTNDNGQRVCNMAARTNLIISSTKFQHHMRHKATWISFDQKTLSQIDHVLVNKRMQSAVKDVRTYRGACADSDHFMVSTTIRQKVKNIAATKDARYKWNTDKLYDRYNQEKFAEEMEKQLKIQSSEVDNCMEIEWSSMKKSINQTAELQIGREKKVNNRDWYNDECNDTLLKKRRARIRWLDTNGQEDRENYERTRKECNKMLRIKRSWIIDKIAEIEKDYRNTNTKSFYKRISEQNRTYKGKLSGIKDREGKMIEEAEEYKKVWMDYFGQLLNDPNMDREEMEERTVEEEIIPEPAFEEVKQIINKSRNGKAPGKDGINIEFLKCGGEKLQRELYLLIKRIWNEENMPQE